MYWIGKSVIITGSSDGIGRAAALEFARNGANVLLHGRSQDKLTAIQKLCQQVAPNAKFPIVRGDICDEENVKQIVDVTIKEFGRIDVVVNNASAPIGDNLTTGHIQDFDLQIRLALRAPILLSQLAFPELKKTGGNILNVSSGLDSRPCDDIPMYAIAKAGLKMFTQCAALEFGQQGVRVNTICPGKVKTEIMRNPNMSQDEIDEIWESFAKLSPIGKCIPVAEIAKAIVFMTSSDASMLNGASWINDGGASLMGLDTKTMQNAAK